LRSAPTADPPDRGDAEHQHAFTFAELRVPLQRDPGGESRRTGSHRLVDTDRDRERPRRIDERALRHRSEPPGHVIEVDAAPVVKPRDRLATGDQRQRKRKVSAGRDDQVDLVQPRGEHVRDLVTVRIGRVLELLAAGNRTDFSARLPSW
jgi:hypothetical protein